MASGGGRIVHIRRGPSVSRGSSVSSPTHSGHQAADRAHDREERARRRSTRPPPRRRTGSPARAAIAARPIRSISGRGLGGGSRARSSVGVPDRRSWSGPSGTAPSGRRRSAPRPRRRAGLLDEHRDRDLRRLGRREADEPGVRLAACRPARPCRTCRPSSRPGPWRRSCTAGRASPSTAWTIAALIAVGVAGGMTRPIALGPIVRVPALAGRSPSPAAAASASPSLAMVDATSAIWSGVTNVSAWP